MPTRLSVMLRGEAVRTVVCSTLVHDPQSMLPEPEDESDDEPEDEPDDEPEDEPDEEPDDEPEDDPRTLYFGQEEGWTGRSC